MGNIRHILLICGSLRSGSTNAAVLHTIEDDIVGGTAAGPITGGILARMADGVTASITASLYDGLGRLPHFNPDADHDPLDPAVVDLRARIGSADAVLFSTPEYAGALPGSFKNLLDWTVGGVEICDKPVAWINTSTAPTGAVNAHDSLRKVLGYTGAEIVEAACAHIPVPRQAVGPDGLIRDHAIRAEIAAVVTALAEHAERRL